MQNREELRQNFPGNELKEDVSREGEKYNFRTEI
jgi:hypothetical protein